ncbi:MAG: HPr-rel-A system PqqD family peptide chaperone [Betaproteobacteria bacterium]
MTLPPDSAAAVADPAGSEPRWRVPAGQRFVFEDFDDGIVMFDALVGSTHLVSATAAEALAIVEETPDLTADAIYRRLLARAGMTEAALPFAAVRELLWQLENLDLLAARTR